MALKSPRIDPHAKAAQATEQRTVETKDAVADQSLDWDNTAKAGTEVAAPAAAPAPAATAVVPAAAPANAMVSAGVSDGFDALDDKIGFGSFAIIKLDKGKFFFGEEVIGEAFDAVIASVRKKFLFKGDDDHLVYSYDQIHDDSGRLVTEHFADWRADGCDREPAMAEYLEAVAQIKTEGKFKDRFGLCSIPPKSGNRLGGYRAELKVGRRRALNQVVTTVCCGPLIKVSNSISFNPWEFLYKSDLSAAA